MCYHFTNDIPKGALAKALKVLVVEGGELFEPGTYNGFAHPMVAAISNEDVNVLQSFRWGLLPSWAKEEKFAMNTLNAKIETLHEKPSFRSYVQNRCLIPASSFYEWQWLDAKGKAKQKFEIKLAEQPLFCFAGLYSVYKDVTTCTIVTTKANTLMAQIHNTKKRMPVILHEAEHDHWLQGGPIADFENRAEINLEAVAV